VRSDAVLPNGDDGAATTGFVIAGLDPAIHAAALPTLRFLAMTKPVMPGLVPGMTVHMALPYPLNRDGRNKSGHDKM